MSTGIPAPAARPEVEQTQKTRVMCAIYENALSNSSSSFVEWQEFTAALTAIVSFVYLVLFSLWSANQSFAYGVGVLQALLSAILFCITLIMLFRRWQSRQEYQQKLAFKFADLLRRVEVELTSDTLTVKKAREYQKEFEAIDVERKEHKGRTSAQFIQMGHRHAAKKYPLLKVKCHECDRVWKPEYETRTRSIFKQKAWRFWKRNYCNNCGVEFDE